MSLAHDGTILLTGAAGFIGYHLADRLLRDGCRVVGVDSLNDYYDPRLKQARLDRLQGRPGFSFARLDLADRAATPALFASLRPKLVVHLAAQAGVRYSLENPHAYVDANLVGFLNVLEGCRQHGTAHLVYASSSSVYGANTQDAVLGARQCRPSLEPLRRDQEGQRADGPHLQPPLRPAGDRPALLHRLRARGAGRTWRCSCSPRRCSRAGRSRCSTRAGCGATSPTSTTSSRACAGSIDVLPAPDPAWSGAQPDPGTSRAPYRLYNIGNHQPVELMHLIATLERALGVAAVKELLPMQPGDVPATYADIADLTRATGFTPATPIEEGVARFVRWYRDEWLKIAG